MWDRYIWTDRWDTWASGLKTILGEADRNASYIVNFFKSQPALNYGFFKPDQSWQFPMDHPSCVATREAMKEVMRLWLDQGCDGFRVDMASSLVKFDDPENSGTPTGKSRPWTSKFLKPPRRTALPRKKGNGEKSRPPLPGGSPGPAPGSGPPSAKSCG